MNHIRIKRNFIILILAFQLIINFNLVSAKTETFGNFNVSPASDQRNISRTEEKTDRFIIKYKVDKSNIDISNKFKDKIRSNKKIKHKKLSNLEAIQTMELTDSVSLMTELSTNNIDISNIEYIYPDNQMKLSSLDTYYDSQWWLKPSDDSNSFGINATSAWEQSQGNGAVIAILDTGVDITHEDLAQNIWTNPIETNNSNDDDNNGYIDDIHGWNFCNNSNQLFDSSNPSDSAHGTHIAGIIAATKDNEKGITGVAPMAKIMPLKVFENGVAYTSTIIEAIDYAEQKGVKIVNCSWGTYQNDPVLAEAIISSNMMFICAAGNDNAELACNPVYPAAFNLSNVISVASTNSLGQLSSFSNYSSAYIQVSAPGEDIISTLPLNTYGAFSGTSTSTALVSGEAALMLGKTPDMYLGMLKETLIESSEKLTALTDKVYQNNKIDCLNAVNSFIPTSVVNNGYPIASPTPTQLPSSTPTIEPTSTPVPTYISGSPLVKILSTETATGVDTVIKLSGNIPKLTAYDIVVGYDKTKVSLNASSVNQIVFSSNWFPGYANYATKSPSFVRLQNFTIVTEDEIDVTAGTDIVVATLSFNKITNAVIDVNTINQIGPFKPVLDTIYTRLIYNDKASVISCQTAPSLVDNTISLMTPLQNLPTETPTPELIPISTPSIDPSPTSMPSSTTPTYGLKATEATTYSITVNNNPVDNISYYPLSNTAKILSVSFAVSPTPTPGSTTPMVAIYQKTDVNSKKLIKVCTASYTSTTTIDLSSYDLTDCYAQFFVWDSLNGLKPIISIYTVVPPANWSTGGTQSDPYLISTPGNLIWMSQNYKTYGGFSGKYFELTNDITLINNWVPIGDNNIPFQGSFNGKGYFIIGLKIKYIRTISVTSSYTSNGLFGTIKNAPNLINAKISNIGLINASIDTYGNMVGAIVGSIESGTVNNCFVIGAQSIKGGMYTGGLVGISYGTIYNCYSTENVINFHSDGSEAEDAANNYMRNCFTVGGLVGKNNGIIKNCFATGSVIGRYNVGGLVGENDGSITNCFATGNIYNCPDIYYGDPINRFRYIGGLVASNNGTIRYGYAYGNGTYSSIQNYYILYNSLPYYCTRTFHPTVANNKNYTYKCVQASPDTFKKYITYDPSEGYWDNSSLWDETWAIDDSGIINNGYPYLVQ